MKIFRRLLPFVKQKYCLAHASELSTAVYGGHKFTRFRGLCNSVDIYYTSINKASSDKYSNVRGNKSRRLLNACQTRDFLGYVDGEEGNVLSKNYEEKRIIGQVYAEYSPEQLFAVVAAVDLYQDFVPWCQKSKIIRSNIDGSFDAELEIGFKFFVESYMSHVELQKTRYIKTTASESGLFDHLINIWEFNPGPVPGTCDLHFLVDFKFQSPLYRQVASMFFKEVVSRLVHSFTDRCGAIYGPAVRVLETEYGGHKM